MTYYIILLDSFTFVGFDEPTPFIEKARVFRNKPFQRENEVVVTNLQLLVFDTTFINKKQTLTQSDNNKNLINALLRP